MSSYQLMSLRIKKQSKDIHINPIENTLISIQNQRNIHFCLYGLQKPYQGGFYHGILQLPQNYPFSAPRFKFFTNNGRFQSGKYVCTTFTSYHQQSWSSSWTIRTILTAILSFFLSQQGGYGTVQQTGSRRAILAKKSLGSNLQNDQFYQLFGQKLRQMGINHQKLKKVIKDEKRQIEKTECISQQQMKKEEVSMKDVNNSLNDKIVSRQNIETSMLQQVNNDGNRNGNNANKYIKLLYVILFIIILILVLKNA